MNKRYAAIVLAMILALSSCGKVNAPDKNSSGVKASAVGNDVPTTDGEDQGTDSDPTVIDDDSQNDERQNDEISTDMEEYIDSILGDGFFGFEMYNYGHIAQSWENRIPGAKLLLEGMAQPGVEETEMELAIPDDYYNSRETEGFMLTMKFEENKPFRVGNTTVEGSGITLIGYENNFIFCIAYFDDNGEYRETSFYELPIDYIPLIDEAVQRQTYVDEPVPDYGQEITGGTEITGGLEAPDKDHEILLEDRQNGFVVSARYNGKYLNETVDVDTVVKTALDAISDKNVTENIVSGRIENALGQTHTEGFCISILFVEFTDDGYEVKARPVPFGTGSQNSSGEADVEIIQIAGLDGKYSIGINDGSEMALTEDYGERLLHDGLGL